MALDILSVNKITKERLEGKEKEKKKKAFQSDQCKEREENNRRGKTRDLFKKIRDTKGIYHTQMDTMKDRNGIELTEAEDIKKELAGTQRRTIQKNIFLTQITTIV